MFLYLVNKAFLDDKSIIPYSIYIHKINITYIIISIIIPSDIPIRVVVGGMYDKKDGVENVAPGYFERAR